MSEFSELFSLLIKSRDINVSALASYCDLDRSTMYKIINGKRNPASREQVRKMAEFMNLNPMETDELSNAYQITRTGREVYYRRRTVKEFILHFQDIQAKSALHTAPSMADFSAVPPFQERNAVPLNSRLQVSSSIHRIFLQASALNHGSVYIIAQPEHLEALDAAASLLRGRSGLEIFHIICISNSKSVVRSQQDYNLQCLTKIIPFLGARCNYHSYYYYDNVNSHFNNLNFMPCVFLTQGAGVACSGDLKTGILFRSDDLVALLKNRFEILLRSTSPLVLAFHSSLEFHLRDFHSALKLTRDSYALSAQPCMMPCISEDILEQYLSEDLLKNPEVMQNLQSYIRTLSHLLLHSFFTRDGVLQFLRTGRMLEIPNGLYRPFSASDRIRILRQLLQFLKDGRDIRLFQPPLDRFPPNLHLFAAADFGYILFDNGENQLDYLLLKEQNMLNAFFDFSCSLEESELLCSPEETADFLKEVTDS